MSKKLTVAALLERKEQLTNRANVTAEIYIPSLDAEIVIQKPSRALCLEVLAMAQDDSKEDKADLHMAYNCIVEPNLKDPGLQKEFGCVEPYDIVEKLFETGEIGSISGHCLKLAGFSDGVKLVKELKN
ncbi:phage tail assembly chaperone [Cohnella cholangitidis]|uniref:Phage XkdN-like tail assembly chaperone protein, TAC n=1 Tax=Cohnella cholangitidis TaxID=2598458 RepID=A0A7G5C3F9_9BACL|nr:hypothetical protein [Cohnella cholangitidis]QMV43743.1 hypothetical protein FPL14_23145 [Cohnella cholangitidis]